MHSYFLLRKLEVCCYMQNKLLLTGGAVAILVQANYLGCSTFLEKLMLKDNRENAKLSSKFDLLRQFLKYTGRER